jgi:hypothetical protein
VGEFVNAAPEPAESAVAAAGVGRERVLDGWPVQMSAVQLAGSKVDFPRSHGPLSTLEHTCDGLKYRAPSGLCRSRSRPKWRVERLAKQYLAKIV